MHSEDLQEKTPSPPKWISERPVPGRRPRLRPAACVGLVLSACLSAATAQARGQKTNLAVFNFQMKSATPDWVWLEKFLSDQITTDFFRGGVSVVARDEMQVVAQRMAWAPEMATGNANAVGQIRQALRIEQLVTGVCSVEGEEVTITGQVVRVSDRKEVFRHTVKGKASDVLVLQKRLSAELLAWLTQGRADQILETLPVWTKSLPAVKALYEGMDLYDQGRYGEAWLKFRQASREDAGYVEALYWVGKMYYFMQRYDHARRALETFVYRGAFHPRAEEAILEYLHTYEAADTSPQTMLDLYTSLGRRFRPGLIAEGAAQNWIRSEIGALRDATLADLLRYRAVEVLGAMGRHAEAASLSAPVFDGYGALRSPACLWNLLQQQALTGRLPEANLLASGTIWKPVPFVQFTPSQTQYHLTITPGIQIVGRRIMAEDRWNTFKELSTEHSFVVCAPPGHAVRSLTVRPVTEGDDAAFTVTCGWPAGSLYPSRTAGVSAARTNGLRMDIVPPVGMVRVHCAVAAKEDGKTTVKGIDLSATWAKVERAGAIEVDCQDRTTFRVDLDGAYARTGPGLIGPVSAGSHSLRFYPSGTEVPADSWTARVTVREGNVVSILGRLPWKPSSAWQGWATALVGREYAGHGRGASPPCLLVDDEAIRVVWSVGGDLWLSLSTDGNRYSPPRKIALPVSSGWTEDRPRLLRDEIGRFVMLFVSRRDAQHRSLLYVTWSRDLAHWSAPSLVLEEPARRWACIQDGQGRFLLAYTRGDGFQVLSSRDAVRWSPSGRLQPVRPGGHYADVCLIRRDDGRAEAILEEYPREHMNPPRPADYVHVVRRLSDDGREWTPDECLARVSYMTLLGLHVRGQTQVLTGRFAEAEKPTETVLLTEGPGGQWKMSKPVPGPFCKNMTAAYGGRWGYVLAWTVPAAVDGPARAHGPFVARGPALEPLFGPMTTTRPVAVN